VSGLFAAACCGEWLGAVLLLLPLPVLLLLLALFLLAQLCIIFFISTLKLIVINVTIT
jgi:hypothetical protein